MARNDDHYANVFRENARAAGLLPGTREYYRGVAYERQAPHLTTPERLWLRARRRTETQTTASGSS